MPAALVALALIATTTDEQRARWKAVQASQRALERRMFAEAGFEPIAEVEADGREVRRVLPIDPYGMLPIPGVEVERRPGGSVTLRLQYRGWSTDPMQVAAGLWTELSRSEGAVFAPSVFTVQPPADANAPPPPPPPPPPICHGWLVRLAAGHSRTASWAACGGKEDARYAYVVRVLQAAVATRPGCTFAADNPFWSYSKCFAMKPGFEDAALEAKAAPLRTAYAAAPGADRLAEARRSLATPGLAPGTLGWDAARGAVGAFLAVQDERRSLLQQLQKLGYDRTEISEADAVRLRDMIAGWSEFIRSQDGNALDLLRRLAWSSAERPRN